jgi:hypothetical protein
VSSPAIGLHADHRGPTHGLADRIVVPNLRGVLRHALPNVVEGKIVPLVLFVGCLQFVGVTTAVLVALAWSLMSVARRLLVGKSVPGLLMLTTVALVAKSVTAIATGSLFVYFLQPTATTALVGLAFLISVPLGRPLAERLAHDLCPFDEATRAHPVLRQFFARVSLWWAVTSMINFAITLWLLLTQSPTTFVLVKSVLGPSTTVCTLVVAGFWFRAHMARAGTTVVYQPRFATV